MLLCVFAVCTLTNTHYSISRHIQHTQAPENHIYTNTNIGAPGVLISEVSRANARTTAMSFPRAFAFFLSVVCFFFAPFACVYCPNMRRHPVSECAHSARRSSSQSCTYIIYISIYVCMHVCAFAWSTQTHKHTLERGASADVTYAR